MEFSSRERRYLNAALKRNDFNFEILVEEASDRSHPLHDRFEWDDKKAGHNYRLHQAMTIITNFRVVTRVDKVERPVQVLMASRSPTSPSPILPRQTILDDLTLLLQRSVPGLNSIYTQLDNLAFDIGSSKYADDLEVDELRPALDIIKRVLDKWRDMKSDAA